jgi:uncharacterized MAPEG superfamily protein
MTLSFLFATFPLKLNPALTPFILLCLAFVPHFISFPVTFKLMDIERKKKDKNFDNFNRNPRRLKAGLAAADDSSPLSLYLYVIISCHNNGLEALSMFSAAVAMAMLTGVERATVEGAAALFIVIRLVYTVIFLTPLNNLVNGWIRTSVFACGFVVTLALMKVAADNY